MRIVIVGAGFTGIQLAKLLVNDKNNVVIIENDEETARHVANRIDCEVVTADGNNLETLESAGIAKADALVCLTSSDEVNMITCSLVDAVYPNVLKIARVRNYAYYVNSTKARKSHASTFSGKHRPLYGIDYMVHPDVEAAEAIFQAVENGAVSSVITFDDSEMQISRVTVCEGSVFAGQKLMDLKNLCDVPLLVSYVEINGQTSLPSGNTVMEIGCTLGILVNNNDIGRVFELCGSKEQVLKKIVIIGAGRIGSIVAEKFLSEHKSSGLKFLGRKNIKKQKIVIIDNDDELAKQAADRFPEAEVLRGDATDEEFLKEERIPSFDLAICSTHNHELNMVLAAYLESLGVKQSISLVTSGAFGTIAQKLGVDVTVALRDVVVDSIMSHMRGNAVKEIHTISEGELEIIECVIPTHAKVDGKKLKEISEPGKFLVLLDKHRDKSEYEIAIGETRIKSGDHLVLISLAEHSKRILDFFTEEEEK